MSAPRCPICAKPVDASYRPFCSRRCSDVDLQRWLTGRYAIPVVVDDETAIDNKIEGDETSSR